MAVIGVPIGVLVGAPTAHGTSTGARWSSRWSPSRSRCSCWAVGALFFSFKLGWLPGTGYKSIFEYGFGPWFSHLLLPWFVLSVLYAAFYARLTRSNLLEMMGEDYIAHGASQGPAGKRVMCTTACVPA